MITPDTFKLLHFFMLITSYNNPTYYISDYL